MEQFIKMPLNMYCELKGVTRKTAYNFEKLGKITFDKSESNRRTFVLVPKGSVIILNEENTYAFGENEKLKERNKQIIQTIKRRNKQICEELKNMAKNLEKIIALINMQGE